MGYQYTINTEEKKASLDLFVGGVFETAYTFNNGNVTLSERPNSAQLTPANLSLNLYYIQQWINLLTLEFSPSQVSRNDFEENIDKSNTKVDARFKNGNIFVTKAKYKFSDKVFDFDPRPQVTMNFTCFKSWYEFLVKFYNAIV